jgi:hypothetical protein
MSPVLSDDGITLHGIYAERVFFATPIRRAKTLIF